MSVQPTVTEIFSGVNGGATSLTYTGVITGGSVRPGDLIVALVGGDTTDAINSVTGFLDAPDGVNFTGNTYTASNSPSENAACRAALVYTVATQALQVNVSQVRFVTASPNHKIMQVLCVSGASGWAQERQTFSSGQATTTTPITGTTSATSTPYQLAVSAFVYANLVSQPTFTPTAGWTQNANTQFLCNGGAFLASMQWKFLTATGTQNGNSPTLSTTQTAGGLISTFRYDDQPAPSWTSCIPFVGTPDLRI